MKKIIPLTIVLFLVGLRSFSADSPLTAPSDPNNRFIAPPDQPKPPLGGLNTNSPGFGNVPSITNNWPTNNTPNLPPDNMPTNNLPNSPSDRVPTNRIILPP